MTPQQVTAQGQAQAAQFNNQAQQSAQQYGSYSTQANQANQALQSFRSTMQDPGQIYSQDLSGAQSMYGFNPQDLLKAQKALAVTQTTLANLPDAIRQQGNYYGTTAGAEANNYAQQSGVLQNVLSGQSNAVGAYQNILNATIQQAQQQAALSFQGQQLKEQNLEAAYSQSVEQMKTAQSNMQYFSNLYQQQGFLTAQQLQALAQAQNSYAQAQLASGQYQQAIAQSQLYQQQFKVQQDAIDAAKGQSGGSQPLQGGAQSVGGAISVNNLPNTQTIRVR